MGQSASCNHCLSADQSQEALQPALDHGDNTKSSLGQVELPRLLGNKDESNQLDEADKVKTPAAGVETGEPPEEVAEDEKATIKEFSEVAPEETPCKGEDEPLEPMEKSEIELPCLKDQKEASPGATPSAEAQRDDMQRATGLGRSGKTRTSSSLAVAKAQRKMERAEAKSQLQPWLQQHGFQTVKSKKTFFWRTSYPLHKAAKQNDFEVVQLLLRAGADPSKTNWRGKTPQEVASSLDRNGSHSKLLQIFKAHKEQEDQALARKDLRKKSKAKKKTGRSLSSSTSAASSGLVRDENGRTHSQAVLAAGEKVRNSPSST